LCTKDNILSGSFINLYVYKYRNRHPKNRARKECHQAFLSRLMCRLLTFHLVERIFIFLFYMLIFENGLKLIQLFNLEF
jgi:hypothetical protein